MSKAKNQVEFMFDITEVDIEKISNCIICNSSDLEIVSSVKEKNNLEFFSTAYCSNCSFVFRNKRPNLSWFKKSWNTRSKDEDEVQELALDPQLEARRYSRYESLSQVLESVTTGRKIIDIGTGPGTGLKAFKDRGWDTTGIEPDIARSKIAKEKHGLNVITCSVEEYTEKDEQFDIATIIHVLEHFHDPINFLKNVVRQVKVGGYLYIEVPDIKNFINWKDSLYLEHMNNFTLTTLSNLARKVGLVPVYRLFPKTQPNGLVHLGVLFEKVETSELENHPSTSQATPSQKFTIKDIRSLYKKGLPDFVFHNQTCLHYKVEEITDVCMTVKKYNYPKFEGGAFSPVTNNSQVTRLLSTVHRAKNHGFSTLIFKLLSKAKLNLKDKKFYKVDYMPL